MHPYYGSDRLAGVSPTLIESVEIPESDMTTPNNSSGGEVAPLTDQSGGTVDNISHLSADSAPVSGVGLLGTQYALPLSSNPYLTPHQSNSDTSSVFVGRGATSSSSVLGLSGPFLPTSSSPSAPFVQFATPTTSTSVYTQMNRRATPQVSFNFLNPTMSTTPIQMMAPQPDATFSTSLAWHHTVPTSIPWAASGPSTAPHIQFTAPQSVAHHTTNSSTTASVSYQRKPNKRKSTVTEEMGLPEKVHVNEDRMAARLEELHLDNNNLQWHPDLEAQWYTRRRDNPAGGTFTNSTTKNDKDNKDSNSTSNKHNQLTVEELQQTDHSARLDFSDILKIGIKSREILPKAIMEEINKPCMQVVLWKPPGDFVREVVGETRALLAIEKMASSSNITDDVTDDSDSMEMNNAERQTSPEPVLSWPPRSATTKNHSGNIDEMEL